MVLLFNPFSRLIPRTRPRWVDRHPRPAEMYIAMTVCERTQKKYVFFFFGSKLYFLRYPSDRWGYSTTRWPVDSPEKRLLSSSPPPFVHKRFKIHGTLVQYSKWPGFYLHFYMAQPQHSSIYDISTKDKPWVTSFSGLCACLAAKFRSFQKHIKAGPPSDKSSSLFSFLTHT
jgi:hypothetical protein